MEIIAEVPVIPVSGVDEELSLRSYAVGERE